MKILLTGANGFIGAEIFSELVKENFEVIAAGGKNSQRNEKNRQATNEIIKIDVADKKTFSELEKFNTINAVIHAAGLAHQFGEIEKSEFEKVNVNGTENIACLAVKLNAKHFILISSTAVYGTKKNFSAENGKCKSGFKNDENTLCEPETFYAASKLESEQIAKTVCEKNNIRLTIFRLAPVIGEGNTGNIERLITAVEKRRFIWIGNGENFKTFIYKKDVARACVEAIKNKKNTIDSIEIFNLADKPVQMREFVKIIGDELNKKILPFSLPPNPFMGLFAINDKFLKNKKIYKISKTFEKWLSDDVYSAAKFFDLYNFKPQTSVREAIKKQIEWTKRK
jgi:UDP-glucose 4-epimerase